MTGKPTLAVLGAAPRFQESIPLGQRYWPDWEIYERAARDIFARRFYTSQRFAGPLVVEFQDRIEDFLGVKHAVAVRSATNGLMIATHTLGLNGKVIVPSWTHVATIQALWWAKCQPAFCDVDPQSQQMSIDSVRRLLDRGDAAGILGVHLWGDAAATRELEALAAEFGVPLYFDAAHAFGCKVDERPIGTFGNAEVFSFFTANVLNTGEGGCLTTDNDELAAKFIAMRGDEASLSGPSLQSATSRMSEMQAAIGMAMLDAFEQNRGNNEQQHRLYTTRLDAVPGIRVLRPSAVSRSNYQSLACIVDDREFGLTRDELVAVLQAENVAAERPFSPLNNSIQPFAGVAQRERLPYTATAAATTLQLPLGARVTAAEIEMICDIIAEAKQQARPIKTALASHPA